MARQIEHRTYSNPAIADWYGPGTVVPHARRVREAGGEHLEAGVLEVAFVGTPRAWKGIDLVRHAVRQVGGARLTVTAPPPPDAGAGERWIGETSLIRGLEVLDASDVVVLCSSDSVFGRGQFPVKLVDAMMSGRLVIASDLPPLRWALQDTGMLVAPADATALVGAIEAAKSVDTRREFGARARLRALSCFTIEAVAPDLASALEAVS